MIFIPVLSLVLSILIIYAMFFLAQKKPILFKILTGLISFIPLYLVFYVMQLRLLNMISYIILILYAIERIAWILTLEKVAGEDQLVWFYIIYIIPFFGWFFYRVINLA